MGAPKGNQFWMIAEAPLGRKRIFKSPQELWDKSLEYFKWCDQHPLKAEEYNGKDAVKCIVNKMRAYTWQGLEAYLGINSLEDYKTQYKEFSEIITHIRKIIYTQKLEGAAAGLLNSNIIARDLGLRDKTDVDMTTGGQLIAPQIIVQKVKE